MIRCNAPGVGGPPDAPEYDGPSIDERVAKKMTDPVWLYENAPEFLTAGIWAHFVDGDSLTFWQRVRYEARERATIEAGIEYDKDREEFFSSQV